MSASASRPCGPRRSAPRSNTYSLVEADGQGAARSARARRHVEANLCRGDPRAEGARFDARAPHRRHARDCASRRRRGRHRARPWPGLPAEKAAEIRRLQAARRGRGDGRRRRERRACARSGGPRACDRHGTDVAIEASDLTLVSGDLRAAPDAIRLVRRTLATIKGNLFWAFAYNVAVIPLAVAGLLEPDGRGRGDGRAPVSSSLRNSLRLRRFRTHAPRGARPHEATATTTDKDALVKRLHRIEGQVRGIERMVADDRYCIDILTQISAVSTALDALAFRILDSHVRHCVAAPSPRVTRARPRRRRRSSSARCTASRRRASCRSPAAMLYCLK